MLVCPSCGRENPDDATFCNACGARLESAAPVREVRKTVTALFCDLVGSTTLAERHDPEVLRPVLQRYFTEMRAAVERHGGSVEKFIGDAVVAVFGMPQVHEDDALRAVRAAVEMRDRLGSPEGAVELTGRIGITTGEVLVGGADQPLIGDTMNTAARLQAAAEPGEILIGEPTFRLVTDAVVAEPIQPVSVKGKAGPVPAYRLVQVASLSPMRTRRLDAPMVGRERERTLLEQAFERTLSDRACQLFTVLGAAGAGKSRLVEEFLSDLNGADVMRGRCLPYGEGITYFPVVEAMKESLGLADFGDETSVREAIHDAVADEDHADAITANLAKLLGAGEGGVAEETFWAVRRLLEARGRARPVVVVFDDLHWGEPTFLDLVEHVADWSRDASILLLCMARPDLLDVRPMWAGGKPNATTISLAPLSEVECSELIVSLLGSSGMPSGVGERITAVAEGNPLFVEEVLRMLIDDGMLRREGAAWVPAADLARVAVPPTISALLSARLDRLSDAERTVIERASVCGKEFHRGALVDMLPRGARDDLDIHLRSLVRKELVGPERSLLPGDDAYRFRHLLIRDAAYDAIPKADRAALHEAFADWLEGVAGDRIAEQEEILGYHLERVVELRMELDASDERLGSLALRAAKRLASAGRRAWGRSDEPAAATLMERAAALLPPDSVDRRELLPDLALALDASGRFERQREVIEEAIDVGRSVGDPVLLNRGLVAEGTFLLLREPKARSLVEHLSVAERALEVLRGTGHDAAVAEALDLLVLAQWSAGDMEAELATAEEQLDAVLRASPERVIEAIIGIHGGMVWGRTPAGEGLRRIRAVLARCAEALPEFSARPPAPAHLSPAWFLGLLGRFDEAEAEVDQARALVEEYRNPWEAFFVESSTGFLRSEAGDLVEAERHLRAATRGWLGIGVTSNAVLEAGVWAGVLAEIGREQEALDVVEEHLALAGAWDLQPLIELGTARVVALGRLGRVDEAIRFADEVEQMVRGTGFVPLLARARRARGVVLAEVGRTDDAIAALREALAIFERKEWLTSAARVRDELAALER